MNNNNYYNNTWPKNIVNDNNNNNNKEQAWYAIYFFNLFSHSLFFFSGKFSQFYSFLKQLNVGKIFIYNKFYRVTHTWRQHRARLSDETLQKIETTTAQVATTPTNMFSLR